MGFKQVLVAEDETEILAASNKGYGFKTQAKQLDTSAKAGKAFLNLSEGAEVMNLQPLDRCHACCTAQFSRTPVDCRFSRITCIEQR